jgi:hypothetical protein
LFEAAPSSPPVDWGTKVRQRSFVTAMGAVAASLAVISMLPASATAPMGNPNGPLTNIAISPDLNCAVNHTGDARGEFFGETACATGIVAGGVLYRPDSIPAGGSADPFEAFTPVSQTPMSGTGTSGDPQQITTVVTAGTNLRVTEKDSYIFGNEFYRTDVTLTNNAATPVDVIVYRAGDCFLQDSDDGFAIVGADGSVACRGTVTDSNGATQPGPRIEQWVPITAGSHYFEDYYDTVWAQMGAQAPFADTCECDVLQDNGAGLSWALSIPAGGSATVSHLTNFSPQGHAVCTPDGFNSLPLGGVASGVIASTVEPLVGGVSPSLAGTVHTINCDTVVPLEDQVDALIGG